MAILYSNDSNFLKEEFTNNRNIIFICDYIQQGIQALQPSSGKLLKFIATQGISFVRPLGINILSGCIIFTNGDPTCCVHALRNFDPFGATLDYQCVASVGRNGKKECNFSEPCNLVCEQSTGRVIVVDSWNDRIQFFQYSQNGNETTLQFLTSFGKSRLEKVFRNPQGLCLNRLNGELFICDSGNSCVSIYT